MLRIDILSRVAVILRRGACIARLAWARRLRRHGFRRRRPNATVGDLLSRARRAAGVGKGAPRASRSLNLALQGGGVRGAFTWGVLDRLLERPDIAIDGISGTSAGAVNAVLLAAGLAEGGREAARAKLESFWRSISRAGEAGFLAPAKAAGGMVDGKLAWAAPRMVADLFSRFLSPYQFNPLDYNPLRAALDRLVDFDGLCARAGVRLFVAATDVSDGRCRLFGPDEISLDAVLASTSLPHLHHAVRIGARHYWDGGYSANPSLVPLIARCPTEDTLLIQLIPMFAANVPTTLPEIRDRLNQIVFSEPLRREIEQIRQFQRAGRRLRKDDAPSLRRRARRHRFHLIDAADHVGRMPPGSSMSPDWQTISHLRDLGREAAGLWLEEKGRHVGSRATVDLAARYL